MNPFESCQKLFFPVNFSHPIASLTDTLKCIKNKVYKFSLSIFHHPNFKLFAFGTIGAFTTTIIVITFPSSIFARIAIPALIGIAIFIVLNARAKRLKNSPITKAYIEYTQLVERQTSKVQEIHSGIQQIEITRMLLHYPKLPKRKQHTLSEILDITRQREEHHNQVVQSFENLLEKVYLLINTSKKLREESKKTIQNIN